MVFDVLYFIAAFELLIYGYMVANREWLFSTYRQMMMPNDVYPSYAASGGVADYDYDGFEVDY